MLTKIPQRLKKPFGFRPPILGGGSLGRPGGFANPNTGLLQSQLTVLVQMDAILGDECAMEAHGQQRRVRALGFLPYRNQLSCKLYSHKVSTQLF
ncbi:hypothetical protein V6Z11_D10G216900 [Gossypium hirsutum]